MASNLELSSVTPKYLWEDLHIKGQTLAASNLADQVLYSIDTQGFTDMDVAERHGEVAAVTMMTSMSAFKQATEWDVAEKFIIRAARTVADHYPLGDDEETAITRGNYWDPVYGKESAQRIVAGDVAKLYDMISVLTGSEHLFALANGLKVVLSEKTVASNDHSRFELIRIIEKPTTYYNIVKVAYDEFMKQYGFESATEDIDQIITITSKALGRAFAEKDMKTVRWCLTTMKVALQKRPDLWKFIAKEIAKNFIPNKKEQFVDDKLRNWTKSAHTSEELLMLITELEGMVFLGLGHDAAIELQST